MDSITMQPIEWLWPERIACGKISIIAGNPGLGKSQITTALAAVVTTGGRWPDGSECTKQGSVIFLSAEDDPADTIKPRLIAAGADVKRCSLLNASIKEGTDRKQRIRGFDLSKDVQRLSSVLRQHDDVRLLVIDPISAYLGKTDSHNNAEIRGALEPLSKMASEHNVAIVLLTHLNKSTHQEPIERIIGSIGLIAAARAGYIVLKDKKREERRYFLPVKNNIGVDNTGFAYCVEGKDLGNNINTSFVKWESDLVDAHEILNPSEEVKPTATNGASAFLQEQLSGGAKPANEIFELGESLKFSKSTLQRAANRLLVVRRKMGFDHGWYWALFEDDFLDLPQEGDQQEV